jgi:hypothetical protein
LLRLPTTPTSSAVTGIVAIPPAIVADALGKYRIPLLSPIKLTVAGIITPLVPGKVIINIAASANFRGTVNSCPNIVNPSSSALIASVCFALFAANKYNPFWTKASAIP